MSTVRSKGMQFICKVAKDTIVDYDFNDDKSEDTTVDHEVVNDDESEDATVDHEMINL